MLYRNPRNRLSGHTAIVEGELAPYFKPADGMEKDISTYYRELLHTAILHTYLPDIDIQVNAVQFCMEMTWI